MSGVYMHLLLNHIPPIAIPIGLVMFAVALVRRNSSIVRAALVLFAVVAAISVPVHMTGEPAEEAVEHLPGVTDAVIAAHEDAASLGLMTALALGVVSVGGLLSLRSGRELGRALSLSIFALALASTITFTWVADLGGKIRHTEIRARSGIAE